ncbi:MAG: hypothetical protein K0B06_10840 [Brevefilum sp.]|nr:hypothetical protein [Brevefilum sp.]
MDESDKKLKGASSLLWADFDFGESTSKIPKRVLIKIKTQYWLTVGAMHGSLYSLI